MIAAPSSGCGKTTITCGLLQALVNRRMQAVSFKCGPDYIDPMFHRSVIGVPTGNLDTFFTEYGYMRYLFADASVKAEIAVLEGVMGYYDGQSVTSTKASSYDIAMQLQTPVILIVNGKGASLSIIAQIQGFLQYRTPSMIQGVILNQVSAVIYTQLKEKIEQELNILVLGYLPFDNNLGLQSRHLGLVLPEELSDLQRHLQEFAAKMEETIDIVKIIGIADAAPPLSYEEPVYQKNVKNQKIRIAVARDSAFCFYYQENLQLLEQMGAVIVPFSPMLDHALPQEVQGLLLGGGYPELYAKKLSDNKSMMGSIKKALEADMPCIAECGGFLYLQETLTDENENTYPMVGFLEGTAQRAKKRERFGYVYVTVKEASVFGVSEVQIPAHEFHYWESSIPGSQATAVKPDKVRTWDCMRIQHKTIAGFPHFYLHGNSQAAASFIEACGQYGMIQKRKNSIFKSRKE